MLLQDLFTQLNSHSHSSCYARLVFQVVTCEVQARLSFLIRKVFIQFTIKSLEQLLRSLHLTARLDQTLRPVMHSKTLFCKFEFFSDFFRNKFPNFLWDFLLNLIMTELDFFFCGIEFHSILFSKLLISLNNCNILFVIRVLLLIKANKCKIVILK